MFVIASASQRLGEVLVHWDRAITNEGIEESGSGVEATDAGDGASGEGVRDWAIGSLGMGDPTEPLSFLLRAWAPELQPTSEVNGPMAMPTAPALATRSSIERRLRFELSRADGRSNEQDGLSGLLTCLLSAIFPAAPQSYQELLEIARIRSISKVCHTQAKFANRVQTDTPRRYAEIQRTPFLRLELCIVDEVLGYNPHRDG